MAAFYATPEPNHYLLVQSLTFNDAVTGFFLPEYSAESNSEDGCFSLITLEQEPHGDPNLGQGPRTPSQTAPPRSSRLSWQGRGSGQAPGRHSLGL